MQIEARPAASDDLTDLVRLYHLLAVEQAALKSLWPVADGLAEPVADSFASTLADDDSMVVIGLIDNAPVGFLWMHIEELLPQAGGARVGVARLIFVETEARGVGVGEQMITLIMEEFRDRGIRLFVVHVSPGHLLAKYFFESNGYSARRFVMHHSEDERWQ